MWRCCTRACLKKAFRELRVPVCGRFYPNEGGVAGYGNRMRVKYTAKWGLQIAEMIFQTRSRVEHGPGACNADAIHESELQNLVVRAINMALGQKDTMYDVLQRNVEAVLTGTDGISLDEIDARLEELQKELLNVANAKENYDSIVDEIYRLREAKQNAQVEGAEREGMKQRISEMQQFLAEQT